MRISLSTLFTVSAVLVASATASAQDLNIRGTNNALVLKAENVSTVLEDRVAVTGRSVPAPYYGVGAEFEGGYLGVSGYSLKSGAGERIGGHFFAAGGQTANYGVYAQAYGTGAFAGYFVGNVHVTGALTQVSDRRVKYNIRMLPEGALNQVMKLKPRAYQYTQNTGFGLPSGEQTGFVAQEIAEIFPELVKETVVASPDKKKAEKLLAVDYMKLIPVLVKAIQEQQSQIDALEAQVTELSQ